MTIVKSSNIGENGISKGIYPAPVAAAGSGFAVLDSDGNSFSVTTSVLDSDGNSFTVAAGVLDSDGNSFTVI